METTNRKKLNEIIFNALNKGLMYGGHGEERFASITELIQPTRMFWLQKRHTDEIKEDVSEKIYQLLGSSVHAILDQANDVPVIFMLRENLNRFFSNIHKLKPEDDIGSIFAQYIIYGEKTTKEFNLVSELKRLAEDYKNQRYMTENRIKVMIANKVISGGYDVYDKETGYIEDYKVTSVFNYIFRNDEGGKIDEYTRQLNCYKYFLENAGYKVNGLRVTMIFRDHKRSQMKFDSTYPDEAETIELKMWDNDTIKAYLLERVNDLVAHEKVADNELPICSPSERWDSKKQWQVFKNNNKRSTKNFYCYNEAKKFAEENSYGKDKYRVAEKISEPRRCLEYCSVNKFCNFYINYMALLADKENNDSQEEQMSIL